MAGAGGVNMEQFEAFFQRADLDRDGRISGAEAVGFFQGSNLPKQVLAQIWTYADQNRIGYLSRPEFYNALKLVTVAQSKRDLTPDIVKAALYGPASAKIPAPQMNLAAILARQPNVVGSAPSPQMAAHALQSSQNYGVRGQTPSSTSVDPQYGRPPSTTFSSSSSDMNRQITQIQPSSTSINPQFGQVQPSNTGLNQQFGQVQPSNMGLNQQFGQVRPSSTGLNQQFGLVRPSSTNLNQQFGQVQPSSTGLNAQFGYVQPSSVGLTQQFGQAPSSSNINQQFLASQDNQSVRPLSSVPAASHPPQNAASLNISKGINMVGPGLPNSNNDWFGRTTGGASTGPTTQVLHRGPAPYSQVIRPAVSSTAVKDPKEFVGSGNRSLDLMFGGDMFSANQTLSHQAPSTAPQPSSSIPTSSAIVPVTSTPQSSENLDPFEAFSSNLVKPSTRVQAPHTPFLPKSNQQVANQVAQTVLSSGVPSGQGNSTLEHPQIVWPKMTRTSIQKYAKVFMEVDVDRDGKISGEEARNLFLSWRLPREVLKQVWDLSDQDNDTMLSLREFCIALYLMERYREGRPLPSTLPNSVMLDEILLSMVGAPSGYGSMGLSATSGMRPQQGLPGAQSITPAGPRPPMHPMFSQADGSMQINQQNSRSSVTDNFNAYQFSNGVENSSNGPDTLETHEKVENNVNVLLDSREKLEFYRTKMQDLVLYKSRCDNRLNEIIERAKADKGEVELLENKYQEKYKQVAEIHSKLTIEEASFREVQERKMELNQAIVKMEQGGSADGILQVRADRIQSDLEELLKALTERCKKHDVQMKSSAIIELPQGWQPGIPEIAVIWDEDWDKFEDEGFSFDVAVPANPKSISVQTENSSSTHGFSPDSVSNGDAMPKKSFSVEADAESAYSADESKSPQGSPTQEYSENHFRKSSDGDTETHRSFDEPSWRNFDNNDDIDPVWGTAKESENVKDEEKYFFGSNDSPQRSVSSPHQTDSPFQQNSSNPLFAFGDDSGSPLSRSSNSPTRNNINSSVGTDNPSWFDSFSGYDSSSFNMQQDSSRGPQNLSRFDSRNSSTGSSFDHGRNYSFDDTDDPFGSSGPFKVPSDSPKKGFS